MEGTPRPVSSPSIYTPAGWSSEINALEEKLKAAERTTGLRYDDPVTRTLREQCSKTLAERSSRTATVRRSSRWVAIRFLKSTLSLMQELPNIFRGHKRFNTVCRNVRAISNALTRNELPKAAEVELLIKAILVAPKRVIRNSGVDPERLKADLTQIRMLASEVEAGKAHNLLYLAEQMEDDSLQKHAELWNTAMDQVELKLAAGCDREELETCLDPLLDQIFGQDGAADADKAKIIDDFNDWQKTRETTLQEMEEIKSRKEKLINEKQQIEEADQAVEKLLKKTGKITLQADEHAVLIQYLGLDMDKFSDYTIRQNKHKEGKELLKALSSKNFVAQKTTDGKHPDWSLTLNPDGSYVLHPQLVHNPDKDYPDYPDEYYSGKKEKPPKCIESFCYLLNNGKTLEQAKKETRKIVDEYVTSAPPEPTVKLTLMSALSSRRSERLIASAFRAIGREDIAKKITSKHAEKQPYTFLAGAAANKVLPPRLVYSLLARCPTDKLIEALNITLSPQEISRLKYIENEKHKQCYVMSRARHTEEVNGEDQAVKGVTLAMLRQALNTLGEDYEEESAQLEKLVAGKGWGETFMGIFPGWLKGTG